MNAARQEIPSRAEALSFWMRSRLLVIWRGLRNLGSLGSPSRTRRWPAGAALADAPARAQWRSPLWTDGRADEFVLVAGKVENLRIAARAFDGVEVPAGACLSFWAQLGRPGARRGFVVGREVRAGCVVPTIAGGLCQLSNALASCAARAGFELVERHAHSARIEQANEPAGQIDATVFWNYVDLRIRAAVPWRLEVALTADHLALTIRTLHTFHTLLTHKTAAPGTARTIPITAATAIAHPPPVARNCLTCGESACFMHQPQAAPAQARSAWLLDEWQPEFAVWLSAQGAGADRFLSVPPRHWLRGRAGNGWDALPATDTASVERFVWTSLRRAGWRRRCAHDPGRRQASVIDGQRWLAQAFARRLKPVHTHLVIDQGLLPHLHALGALGGRSYDVLAVALPMREIERRLDLAARARPPGAAADATLSDYRADPALVEAEHRALERARRIVTAHSEVARYWRERGVETVHAPWSMPPLPTVVRGPCDVQAPPLVVLPASALARKGAGELAEALRGMDCRLRLRVLGTASDDPRLWRGIEVEQGHYTDDWLTRADVVALPAHIEHSPRALLMALAAGLPVIATPACGLQGMAGVTEVPAGDVGALTAALADALARVRMARETGAAVQGRV